MMMMMMMIVGLWRRCRRRANRVHTKLGWTAIRRLRWTILNLMVMVSLVSNLLLVVMRKSLLGRRSSDSFASLIQLCGLLSSTLVLHLFRLQRSVTSLQSLHLSFAAISHRPANQHCEIRLLWYILLGRCAKIAAAAAAATAAAALLSPVNRQSEAYRLTDVVSLTTSASFFDNLYSPLNGSNNRHTHTQRQYNTEHSLTKEVREHHIYYQLVRVLQH